MTFLLVFLTIPINAFASNDDVSSSDKVMFEILPKASDGSSGVIGGMGLEILGNYKPSSKAKDGFLSYNAIDRITLSDLTGKWEGWKLTAEATPLMNNNYEFPRGTLSLVEPSGVISLSGQVNLPKLSYEDRIIIDDGQVLIAGAEKDSGMGNFELEFDEGSLSLAIAENSSYDNKPESGLYHTTLNWNLVSSDEEVRVLRSDDYSIQVDTDYLYENIEKPVKDLVEDDYYGGYNDGYNDAVNGLGSKLDKDSNDSYYNNGYDKGYNDGLAGLDNNLDETVDSDSFNDGYNSGYLDGLKGQDKDGDKDKSYNDGYNIGYNEGLDKDSNYDDNRSNSNNVYDNNSNLNSNGSSDSNGNSNSNGSYENNNPNDKESFFGERLPSTSTNIFNFMLIGVVLLAGAASVYFVRRKKARK